MESRFFPNDHGSVHLKPRIRFVVYIDPKPKLRPRFSRKSKRVYTPAKCTAYEEEVREQVKAALGDGVDLPLWPVGVALSVDVDFLGRLPNSSKKSRASSPLGMHWRPISDDIDNLQKAVFDALNGVLWADDRQIVEVRTRKLFASRAVRPGKDELVFVETDDRPRICLAIRPVGDPPYETCASPNKSASDYWKKD